MVGNPATLSRCSPLLHRFVGLSTKPIPHHLLNPSRVTNLGRYAVSNSIRHLGASQLGRNHLDCGRFQLLSAPGGGFGGIRGSGGGNYGGGGRAGDAADGSGGGEGDKKWSFVSWYLELLAQYPVLTKAITSALLTLAGDLICQLLIDKVASFDVKRTFLFSLLGLVLVGPTLHYWYLYLSKLVTMPGASGAFLRLVLDQFLFAPTFIGVFLSTLVTLEGRPSKVVPKLQQEWFSAVIANWKLWIPFQFLNFRFVPQQFQVLAANAVALAWNVILSFKAHKEVVMK